MGGSPCGVKWEAPPGTFLHLIFYHFRAFFSLKPCDFAFCIINVPERREKKHFPASCSLHFKGQGKILHFCQKNVNKNH